MIKLLALGDICLQTKNNKDPFSGVHRILKDKDVLFGNLETALSEQGRVIERAVPLHVSPGHIAFLKKAGFDVMNVANNHVMDRGLTGFDQTLKTLQNENIDFVGGGNVDHDSKPLIIDRNDLTLGFLAYNGISFPLNEGEVSPVVNLSKEGIQADIDSARKTCDLLIVSLHWGTENVFFPSPAQIELARWIIDCGVNLILGHHPSVLQGVESYKNGLIVYSLGNFQFIDDAPESIVERTKETAIFGFELSRSGVVNHWLVPCRIDEFYCPQLLQGEEAEKNLSLVRDVSYPIENNLINDKRWFELIAWNHLATNLDAWRIRIKRYGIKQLPMMARWLILRFNIRCYIALLRNLFKKNKGLSGT